jgi:hypothetical protein
MGPLAVVQDIGKVPVQDKGKVTGFPHRRSLDYYFLIFLSGLIEFMGNDITMG